MSVAGQIEYERRIKEQTQLRGYIASIMSLYVQKNSQIIHLITDYTAEHWTYFICGQPITPVSLEINGAKIDSHYGSWLDIWDEIGAHCPQTKNRADSNLTYKSARDPHSKSNQKDYNQKKRIPIKQKGV